MYFLIFITLFFSSIDASVLTQENEFLRILVNQGPENKGRFAIETTKGDPLNKMDDDQPLIYGRPVPWTSYTTILVDGVPYIFGGKNTKNEKRSGSKFQYGDFVSQEIKEGVIKTIYQFNDVMVQQNLSFMKNPSTKVKDTVKIQYSIDNRGLESHEVGLRVMMDTKLGSNDGAPFRWGDKAITVETECKDLLDYFQAFDSLTSPNVIAQGYFRLPQENITPPDILYLANWGSLFDSAWEYGYVAGRSFVRAGEDEQDTALALCWNPKKLAPNQQVSYQTAYGLGGVSVAPGLLSLGLTSPSELSLNQKSEVLIVGYVVNAGGYDSQQTVVNFTLPPGFEVIEGTLSVNIGTLAAGSTYQLPLKVKIGKGINVGMNTLLFEVKSSTLDSNKITRKIDILQPPLLGVSINAPNQKKIDYDAYFPVDITVTNPSSMSIDDISVILKPGLGLVFSDIDPYATKHIDTLLSLKSTTLTWVLKVDPSQKQPSSFIEASVFSSVTGKTIQKKNIQFLDPSSTWQFFVSKKSIQVSDYFFIGAQASYYGDIYIPSMTLIWDPDYLIFKRLSKEDVLKQAQVILGEKEIYTSQVPVQKKRTEFAIAKWHFKAKKSGKTTIICKTEKDIFEIPVLISTDASVQETP